MGEQKNSAGVFFVAVASFLPIVPRKGKQHMSTTSSRTYRDKAQELRKTATEVIDAGVQQALLELARNYDQLAASVESASLIGPNSRTGKVSG